MVRHSNPFWLPAVCMCTSVCVYSHWYSEINTRAYCRVFYSEQTCIHVFWITHVYHKAKTSGVWWCPKGALSFLCPPDALLLIIIQSFDVKTSIRVATVLKVSKHFTTDFQLPRQSSSCSLVMASIIYIISTCSSSRTSLNDLKI